MTDKAPRDSRKADRAGAETTRIAAVSLATGASRAYIDRARQPEGAPPMSVKSLRTLAFLLLLGLTFYVAAQGGGA